MVIPYFPLILRILPIKFGKSFRVRNQVVEMQLTKNIWLVLTKKTSSAERICKSLNQCLEK